MMFYPRSSSLVTPILSNSSLQGFECFTRKDEKEEGRTVKEEGEEEKGDDGKREEMGEEQRGVEDIWEKGRRTVEILLLSKLLVRVLRRGGLGGVTSLKKENRSKLV